MHGQQNLIITSHCQPSRGAWTSYDFDIRAQ